MSSLLERRLLVVTGKGGVGKTTLAAALGVIAARRGLRTVVIEVGDQARLPELFGHSEHRAGVESMLREGLWSITIDPDQALLEWLQRLGGRVSGRVLASSGTFQYFAAAAPGAKELFTMVKIWELTRGRRWDRGARGFDLAVLDAPATGNALGLLASPQTFGAIARVGPVAGQAQRLRELLEDPAQTAFAAVTLASEMAVTETIELQDALAERIGRRLDAVIANALLPQRFTAADMERIDALADGGVRGGTPARGGERALREAAARAAHTVHERSRVQRNQLARLRRRGFEVLGVPFSWTPSTDLRAIERIAEQLERSM